MGPKNCSATGPSESSRPRSGSCVQYSRGDEEVFTLLEDSLLGLHHRRSRDVSGALHPCQREAANAGLAITVETMRFNERKSRGINVPALRDGSSVAPLVNVWITKVNTLLPLPNPRTHSSSLLLRDSRILRPHSARLFRAQRRPAARAGYPEAALKRTAATELYRPMRVEKGHPWAFDRP
jgi:hypothetical protein